MAPMVTQKPRPRKASKVLLEVEISRRLLKELTREAHHSRRSLSSVVEQCLDAGLEQVGWDHYADALLEKVQQFEKQKGVTEKEKVAFKRRALTNFAQTVADVVGSSS